MGHDFSEHKIVLLCLKCELDFWCTHYISARDPLRISGIEVDWLYFCKLFMRIDTLTGILQLLFSKQKCWFSMPARLRISCCVCAVLPASHFLKLFQIYGKFVTLRALHFFLLIFIPEQYRSAAQPPYSTVNHGAALLSALLKGIKTVVVEIEESNTSVQFRVPLCRETNILDLLLLTVAVTLDKIQSNGGYPGKQKMMYSLPGDRKAIAFLRWMMSKKQQSEATQILLHFCYIAVLKGRHCHRSDLLHWFHSEQHTFLYCIVWYKTVIQEKVLSIAASWVKYTALPDRELLQQEIINKWWLDLF